MVITGLAIASYVMNLSWLSWYEMWCTYLTLNGVWYIYYYLGWCSSSYNDSPFIIGPEHGIIYAYSALLSHIQTFVFHDLALLLHACS